LLLCLVLLTSLSLLGLAASTERQLKTKIMGNIERAAQAELAAGWALAWAESWLLSLDGSQRPSPCEAGCEPGEIVHDETSIPPAPEQADQQWWLDRGFAPGIQPATGEVLEPYLARLSAIAVIGEIPVPAEYTEGLEAPPGYYRVLARAQDATGQNVTVLESVVARPWGPAAWADPLPPGPGQPRFCSRFELTPCGRLAWRRLR
jgi:Tfp pilus assembly protein PilX